MFQVRYTEINDTSLENLIIGELKSGIKMGMALPEKFPHPSELKKHHLWEIENFFPQCTDNPDFIYVFKRQSWGFL